MNFAKSSGVILDVCKNDGVWLDRGELQRVLGFVDAGGMTVSREREKEKLAEEQRRLASIQAASMGGARMSAEVTFVTHRHRWGKSDDVGDSLQHLLVDALGIVFRNT
jgi:Zn-finger nucleic acid-binding protein